MKCVCQLGGTAAHLVSHKSVHVAVVSLFLLLYRELQFIVCLTTALSDSAELLL